MYIAKFFRFLLVSMNFTEVYWQDFLFLDF